MRKLFWILIILILLLTAAVVLFPAKLALDLALQGQSQIRAEQVSGTIWRGRIGSLSRGEQMLGALDWTLHPMPLLQRAISADLMLKGPQMDLSAAVLRRPDQSVSVRGLRALLPASLLAPVIDAPALELRGELLLSLSEVEILHMWPRSIIGEAVWQNASVAGAAEARLGDLVAEFSSRPDGSLAGVLSDRGGPLELDGEFLLSLRGYEVSALLDAPAEDHSLQKALQYIGEANPEGGRLLLIEGGPRL